MFWRRIGVYITLALMCCATVVVSANPCEQPPIHSATSYVDAIAFLNGRMSNLTYGEDDWGDFIEFHAEHVLIIALAFPLSCSIIRLWHNKDVHITPVSSTSGYIGTHWIHIVFKTVVAGPI